MSRSFLPLTLCLVLGCAQLSGTRSDPDDARTGGSEAAPTATPSPPAPAVEEPVPARSDEPSRRPAMLEAGLPRGERGALLDDARTRIERAESHLQALDERSLDDDARVRLEMTRSLLAEARGAAGSGDAVRAAALAEKAEILAADLSP